MALVPSSHHSDSCLCADTELATQGHTGAGHVDTMQE